MNIQDELFKLQDLKYKEFHSRLMPNINPDLIIGVRVPDVRRLSKRIIKEGKDSDFLKLLPHKYYEENNLHGFIISQMKDYDTCIKQLDTFLPCVDNWATCDGIRPVSFKKNTDRLIFEIDRWIASDEEYTVRFGLEMLMTFYLDENFDESYLEKASAVTSDKYYVNMMIAWFFATALAKQYEKTIPFIEEKRLSIWVHNKTIQKALESYRVDKDRKSYLRKLKI